jgi:hypothetical protein
MSTTETSDRTLEEPEELVTILQAADHELRAVLVQVEAATEMARENLALIRESVARMEERVNRLETAVRA